MFEAISHPLRIDILMELSKSPRGFADLKRALNISSSGLLDFHLKKMEAIIMTNAEGLYTLNDRGWSAVLAVNVVSRYGWRRQSFLVVVGAYIVMNVYTFFMFPSMFLWILLYSSIWTGFYVYWRFIKRRVFVRHRNGEGKKLGGKQ